MTPIPSGWRDALESETRQPYYGALAAFLAAEREWYTVFPPEPEVFTALDLTPPNAVKVVIIGQDPYHDHDQAHGLAFSVRPGIPPPPSLVNIFRELRDDVGCATQYNGCLIPWAKQGVLLLNTVLTVRAHEPGSHRGKGWERFTDAALRHVNDLPGEVVFVLWGAFARKKLDLIDVMRHTVIAGAHPSPLSAHNGFFGSRPFSRINAALQRSGHALIDWQL